MEKKNRNYNLDFFRGLAAISIVFIHTVCKSGSEYIPIWMLDISLLVDVPLFIFISGMTFNHIKDLNKLINSFINVWRKWLIFIAGYFVIVLIFRPQYFTLMNIMKAAFFSISYDMPLSVIAESLWFMPMYLIVSLVSSIIINYCNDNKIEINKTITAIFILYMINLYYFNNSNINLSQMLMYTIIYMLGYYLYNVKISTNKFRFLFIITLILNLLMFLFGTYPYIDMHIVKFKFDIMYLIYSIPSLLICWYYIQKLNTKKTNRIVYIGQNALLFYFAQGVSSSLMFYIARKIVLVWPIKLVIIFIINLIGTIIIAYILKKVIDFIEKRITI